MDFRIEKKKNPSCPISERKQKGRLLNGWKQWIRDDSGIGVVEVILILVILIGLVIIFKGQIESIVKDIFKAITSGVSEVVK